MLAPALAPVQEQVICAGDVRGRRTPRKPKSELNSPCAPPELWSMTSTLVRMSRSMKAMRFSKISRRAKPDTMPFTMVAAMTPVRVATMRTIIVAMTFLSTQKSVSGWRSA